MKTETLGQPEDYAEVCKTLLNDVFRSEKSGFSHAVKLARRLLDAEYCSVFDTVVTPENERVHKFYLRLRAEFPTTHKTAPSYDPQTERETPCLKLEIRPEETAGLTGHIAYLNQRKPVKFNFSDLSRHPSRVAKQAHDHLRSGKSASVIIAPLQDRRGNLIGLLKCENKLDEDGFANQEIEFNDQDVSQIESFAKIFSSVLELRALVVPFRDLVRNMAGAAQLGRTYENLLSKAKRLLLADRGELAIWDERQKLLMVKAVNNSKAIFPSAQNCGIPSCGAISCVSEVGKPLPQDGFVAALWNSKDGSNSRIIEDVLTWQEPYKEADSRVRSAIAIILKSRPTGHRIGIINLESFRVNYFCEEDVALLRGFAPYAALILNFGEKRQKEIKRLRTAKMERQSLLDNVSEGVCRTTVNGMYELVNKAMAKIYGVPPTLFATTRRPDGRAAQDFYVNPERRNELLKLLRTQRRVDGFQFKAYYGIDKKKEITVRQNVRLSSDNHHIDATFEDVTQQCTIMQRVLASAISTEHIHDTLAPAQDIIEEASKLFEELRQFQKPPKKFPKLEDRFLGLIRSAARIKATANDVKRFLHNDLGDHVPIDIVDLISKVYKGYDYAFGNAKIKFTLALGDGAPGEIVVYGYPNMLGLFFSKLFDNTLRYVGDGRGTFASITIRSPERKTHNPVLIHYVDDGPGFDDAYLKMPYSWKPSKADASHGFGLGLASMHGIIELLHNGEFQFGNLGPIAHGAWIKAFLLR